MESLKTALEQDKGDIEVRKEVPKSGNDCSQCCLLVLLRHRVTDVLLLPAFLVEGIFVVQTRVRRFCFRLTRKNQTKRI